MSEQQRPEMAFPAATDKFVMQGGMTLRDYFAAKAMQAALPYRRKQFETDNEDQDDWDVFIEDILAPEAYCIADAMLKARQG